MSSKPKAAMKTRQQQREQANQSDAAQSSPTAISKNINVEKLSGKFLTFKGEVRSRLHFLEEKWQQLEERLAELAHGDTKRPYVEKYADIEIDVRLLTTHAARNRWRAFLEMPTEDVSKTFHDAYAAGYFKLILFMQDKKHWDVPSKEAKLWNWLKNQRVLMREYENGSKQNQHTVHPRYYEILKHECGIKASKLRRSGIV
jgi:hypothetical protein